MKYFFLIIFFFLSVSHFFVNAQNPQWNLLKLSSKEADEFNGDNHFKHKMEINHFNKKFIIGSFNNQFTFQNQTVYGSGNSLYLLKMDEANNLRWIKSIAHTNVVQNNDLYFGIKTDLYGNVYISIRYSTPIVIFGNNYFPIEYGNYIAKLNTEGEIVYEKNFNRHCVNNIDMSNSDIDLYGNLYLIGTNGYYGNYLEVDTNAICELDLEMDDNQNTNAFIAKYNPVGNLIWSKSYQSNGHDSFTYLKCFNNDVYVAGYGLLGVLTNYSSNAFIAKLDTQGVFSWNSNAGYTGNSNYIRIRQINIIDDDNIIVTYQKSVSDGNTLFFETGPNIFFGNNDDYHTILVNYDLDGNVNWQTLIERYKHDVSIDNVNNLLYAFDYGKFEVFDFSGNFISELNYFDDNNSLFFIDTKYMDQSEEFYFCGRLFDGKYKFGEIEDSLTENVMFFGRMSAEEFVYNNDFADVDNKTVLLQNNNNLLRLKATLEIESINIYNTNGSLINNFFNINSKQFDFTLLDKTIHFLEINLIDNTAITKKVVGF